MATLIGSLVDNLNLSFHFVYSPNYSQNPPPAAQNPLWGKNGRCVLHPQKKLNGGCTMCRANDDAMATVRKFGILASFIIVLLQFVRYFIALGQTTKDGGFFAEKIEVFDWSVFYDPRLWLLPAEWFFLILASSQLFQNGIANRHLTVTDSWITAWYWLNAWFFPISMNGASSMKAYAEIGVWTIWELKKENIPRAFVVWGMGVSGLIIQFFCVWILWAITSQSALRRPLELMTGTMQVMSTLIYVLLSIFEEKRGFFNLFACSYDWFFFVLADIVMGFVPFFLIYNALHELTTPRPA